MNKQNGAHPTAEASTGTPTRAGAIRRFFNAWRRGEKLMDAMASNVGFPED
jgi:hypothetical protein